jgi:hypothetical protein
MSHFGAPLDEVWGQQRTQKKPKSKKPKRAERAKKDPVCDLRKLGYNQHLLETMNEQTAVTSPNLVTPFPSSYAHGSKGSDRVDFYDKWEPGEEPSGSSTHFQGSLPLLSSLYPEDDYPAPDKEDRNTKEDAEEDEEEAHPPHRMHHSSKYPEDRDPPHPPPSVPEHRQEEAPHINYILADVGLYFISGILLIVIMEIFVKMGIRISRIM